MSFGHTRPRLNLEHLQQRFLADGFQHMAHASLHVLVAEPPACLLITTIAGQQAATSIEQRALRSEDLVPFNKVEIDKWAELVKRSGAQVD